jgi:hypothetical protein
VPASVHERGALTQGSAFRFTPLEHVRVLFVSFVQGLFHAAPPGHFHWEPDNDKTEIIIRDENPINVDSIGERPAINFTMGPIQFYHLGMDDLVSLQFTTGRKEKGVLIPGTMSINVSSRNDIEAHNLAWVVGEHIWLLRELFLRKGFFELGRGIQVTPPSPPGSIVAGDSADEWYLSTVSVPWQFARKSAFTPLGREIVQSIEQHIELNDPRRVESMGPALDPTGFNLPVSIQECRPESFAPLASDARGGTPDPAGVKNNPLPLQPHPLNPAKSVVVKTVRPYRAGLRRSSSGRAAALPIDAACMEKSGGAK